MTNLLTLNQVSYQVEQQVIIDNLSLIVKEGEYVTLTGPSGSGKSTILKLMASLLSPTNGEILFHQQNIEKLAPENYRQKVSYCFQQPTLFGETVKENVQFPYLIRKQAFQKEAAVQLFEQFQLSEKYLDKKITELSGGEKQRIALIRNVLFLPEILLLDEVTTGLDEENKQIVNRSLQQLNDQKQVTLIRVTHDLEEIKQATRIETLVAGKLEEKK